jgi:hypothetical protein
VGRPSLGVDSVAFTAVKIYVSLDNECNVRLSVQTISNRLKAFS